MELTIIKIENKNNQQLVSARELHAYLELAEKFTDWIERILDRYGFAENTDYITISEKSEISIKPLNQYYLTLDCAKQLAMVANNEKGKLARLYFIEAERKYKESLNNFALPSYQIENAIKRAERWIEEYKEKEALQALTEELKPKADTLDLIDNKEGLHSIRNTAKLLQFPERKFIEFCLERKILFRDAKGQLIGFADKINNNICYLKTVNLHEKVLTQTLFTNHGISWLSQYIIKLKKGGEQLALMSGVN